MDLNQLEMFNNPSVVYPWELAVFAELSLFAETPKAICSFFDSESEFVDMINTIRGYQPKHLKKRKESNFVNALLMVTALQQFKDQENIYTRLYRYDFFWNFVNEKINMPKEFAKYFDGLSYAEFRDFGILVYFYASLKHPTEKIIEYFMQKNRKIVEYLKEY